MIEIRGEGMERRMKKILVVEDELKILEAVKAYLEKDGFVVLPANDGEEAIRIFNESAPDLIILDLMLPKVSGEEVCKSIRRKSRVPIIMLTAKVLEEDKLNGFQIGADDYVTKPFSPRELVARVKSVIRRSIPIDEPLYSKMSWNNNDLEIDIPAKVVKKKGTIVSLTPNEYKLLEAFVAHPSKIYTREELIAASFGYDYEGFERTIDVHIKNLRSKIEVDSQNPVYIVTVRGIGYKFGGSLIQ